MKIKILTLLLVAAVSASFFAFTAKGEEMEHIKSREYYDTIIEKETAFIQKLVLPNGAIGMFAPKISSYSDYSMPTVDGIEPSVYTAWKSAKIMPYFSDTAVYGLIKSAGTTGNYECKDICLNYINWYISHMNTAETDVNGVDGTVYDYYMFVKDDKVIEVSLYDANASKYPTGNPYDYDSTDSYAALFLQIMYEYANVFDKDFFDGKRETVDRLVSVMLATYVPSIGLTYAKPNYTMCYLMDNCEVYCGFECAESIYRTYFGDTAEADNCRDYADAIKNAITDTMWSDEKGMFYPYVSANGTPPKTTDITTFYPDGSCQLFPIIFGLIDKDDEKAEKVYNDFKTNFCVEGSTKSDWGAYKVKDVAYPWCILLRAVITMGDTELAERYIDTMYTRFVNRKDNYPFYNSEAGHLLLAINEIYPLSEYTATEESSEESSEELSGEESKTVESETELSETEISESETGGTNKKIIGITAGVLAVLTVASCVFAFIKKKKK